MDWMQKLAAVVAEYCCIPAFLSLRFCLGARSDDRKLKQLMRREQAETGGGRVDARWFTREQW
jgi:hypothetical protein